MTRLTRLAVVIAALGLTSCETSLGPGTGLMGTMTRAPIAPVCANGTPCSAPLAAHFDVYQGGKQITGFDSDAGGQYSVRLAPGTYRIVPSPSAPIMNPTQQYWTLYVTSGAMTVVNLEFDTGIR